MGKTLAHRIQAKIIGTKIRVAVETAAQFKTGFSVDAVAAL